MYKAIFFIFLFASYYSNSQFFLTNTREEILNKTSNCLSKATPNGLLVRCNDNQGFYLFDSKGECKSFIYTFNYSLAALEDMKRLFNSKYKYLGISEECTCSDKNEEALKQSCYYWSSSYLSYHMGIYDFFGCDDSKITIQGELK